MPSTPTEAKSLNLTALIERLENADGPSRELDRAIQCGVGGWHRITPSHTRNKHGAFISPADWIGANSDGSPILDSLHGTTMHRDVPAVTASIDSAVALAERVVAMEGRKLICFFCAGGQLTPYNADETSPDYHPKAKIDNSVTAGWMAHVAFYNSDGATGHDDYSHGRTAPLAICLATLRALSAQEGSK